jgi:hypothetical protein
VNVDAWLTALMVTPPTVLGRRLKPFSLAHSLILERAGNTFWVGGEKTVEDFFQAVDVCARDLQENRERINEPQRRMKRWIARTFRKASAADVQKFAAYIQDHATCCARESTGGASRDMASPWQFRIAAYLIERGFAEERAWNMPLNLARCYFDANEEMNGDNTLVPAFEESAADLIVKADELMKAGECKAADVLYGRAQEIFDRRNNARKALEESLKG